MTHPATPPNDNDSPLAQVLAASRAAAQRRLGAGVRELQSAMPGTGVVLERVLRRKGRPALRVLFCWPGRLLVLDDSSGQCLYGMPAASLHATVAQGGVPREVRALIERLARKGPLLRTTFQPPQAQRLSASFGLDGVVRVRAVKGGALLAESEPGQPYTLRASFTPLAVQSLAPRMD